MPDPHSNDILYPHCFYDRKENCLWIEAYSSDKKENVYTKYRLPRFIAGSCVLKTGIYGISPKVYE